MPSTQIPPVPPLTEAGFADPVWARWLQQLRAALNSPEVTYSGGLADTGYLCINPGSGFVITLPPTASNVIFTHVSAFASGSIAMPAAARDGLMLRVVSTAGITSFNVAPAAGQTVLAAPGTLAANVSVAWLYRLADKTWYRMQ